MSPNLVDRVLRDYQEISREKTQSELGLSEEDAEILTLIADGATNREIADQLFISPVTAKRRVQEILEKMGASNRAQAAAEAARRGLV